MGSSQTNLDLSSRFQGNNYSNGYMPTTYQTTSSNLRRNLESTLNIESPRSYLSSNLLQNNQNNLHNYTNGNMGSGIRRNLQSVLNFYNSGSSLLSSQFNCGPSLLSPQFNYGNNYITNPYPALNTSI